MGAALGIDAVLRSEFAVDLDVRSRRAEIRRRTMRSSIVEATQKLDFDRHRKLLIRPHRRGILGMDHDAAVAVRPARPSRRLLAEEAVDRADSVPLVRDLATEMAEPSTEAGPVGVVEDESTIANRDDAGGILPHRRAGLLVGPALEVGAVEEWHPRRFERRRGERRGGRRRHVGVVRWLRERQDHAERVTEEECGRHTRNASSGSRIVRSPPVQSPVVRERDARRRWLETGQRRPEEARWTSPPAILTWPGAMREKASWVPLLRRPQCNGRESSFANQFQRNLVNFAGKLATMTRKPLS